MKQFLNEIFCGFFTSDMLKRAASCTSNVSPNRAILEIFALADANVFKKLNPGEVFARFDEAPDLGDNVELPKPHRIHS